MALNAIAKDINVFSSSAAKDNIYSLEYQKNSQDFVHDITDEQEKVEPFENEQDALDFINFYSQKVLNEKR